MARDTSLHGPSRRRTGSRTFPDPSKNLPSRPVPQAHRLKNRASSLYRCLLDELGLGGVPRLLLAW